MLGVSLLVIILISSMVNAHHGECQNIDANVLQERCLKDIDLRTCFSVISAHKHSPIVLILAANFHRLIFSHYTGIAKGVLRYPDLLECNELVSTTSTTESTSTTIDLGTNTSSATTQSPATTLSTTVSTSTTSEIQKNTTTTNSVSETTTESTTVSDSADGGSESTEEPSDTTSETEPETTTEDPLDPITETEIYQ